MPPIAVLIATKNRSAELANRALKSVEAQTLRPEFLIVVDDSEQRYREDNRRIVASVSLTGSRVMYFENDRTWGASGAWNVGLDRLQRLTEDPAGVFVALLDDDDAWEARYLEECADAIAASELDMVAADIVRHEVHGDEGSVVPAPETLDARVFLVRNPGIQGSNLFARLSTILKAGMFDEALRSTTDRDLCIRIADLGGVAYRRLPRALVHHHAEAGPTRLSTPGSAAKLEGLSAFWQKYRSRMSEDERRAFHERAGKLFGWPAPTDEAPSAAARPPRAPKDAQLALLVGVIVSSIRAGQVERLLDGLAALRDDPRLVGLEVALLENGPRVAGARHLNEIADRFRERGVGCFVLPIEQQETDAMNGRFGREFSRGTGRVSIAVARTMLQSYLYELGRRRPGVVVWILDEDMILETLTWQHGRGVIAERLRFIDSLAALQDSRVDIAIGTVTDAPPLPFASCVRTQLVDAYHNLEALAVLSPDQIVVDRMNENMAHRARCEDYYYDLSRRDTDHLESPFWFTPSNGSARARDVFIEMVSKLPRILAGEQVFRPLILEAGIDPVAFGKPSVHRGGNAFVFDIDALRDFSNAVPSIDGQSTRRSDMVWSLLNRYVAGRTVVKVPIAVRQDRSGESTDTLDLEKLGRDIHGFALYSALESLFLQVLQARRGSDGATKIDLASLGENDVQYALGKFHKFLRERTAAFVLSFHRAAGLAVALERYASAGGGFWWLSDPECAAAVKRLRGFVDVLRREYAVERLRAFQAQVHAVRDDIVADYVAGLRDDAVARPRQLASAPTWLEEQRTANARAVVERERPGSALRHLGSGSEGVSFTDGVSVFKCIDYWKTRSPDAQVAFLRSLVGAWSGLESVYPLQSVTVSDARIVIAYPYEPSEPYRGGNALGVLALLRDLRAAGIVSTNMHPSNLVVVGDRVKLIDFGADIRRFTEDGFRKMARRAFLALRHTFHPELKLLMRRSIDSEALPELNGFDRFWSAIDPPIKEKLVDARVIELVAQLSPARAVDYGCGRGNIAAALALRGVDVVGYDPDPHLASRWQLDTSGARYLGADALAQLRSSPSSFDVVVCSLVLCTLGDHEARIVLDDLRRLMKPDGDVFIVVCNPGSVAAQTTLQERRLPANWDPDAVFTYQKLVRSSGRCRDEIHRPLSRYEELLRGAGLERVSLEETDGINIETFERAAEFLLMRCRARKDGDT